MPTYKINSVVSIDISFSEINSEEKAGIKEIRAIKH